jgi:Flp pilus assembly protein TadD
MKRGRRRGGDAGHRDAGERRPADRRPEARGSASSPSGATPSEPGGARSQPSSSSRSQQSGATRARPSGAPRARTWSWAGAALVAAAAVAVYLNSLGGALFYDDVMAVLKNPLVHAGDVGGILSRPSWNGGIRDKLWRPTATLTFAMNHALHGLAPVGYHVANVLLHAAVSVLVLIVFARTLAAPRAALAAAVLFATHPIHTEAVASVVGRAEVLAAGGFFLAWLAWLAADDAERAPAGTRGVPAWLFVVAAVAAYVAAMGGKENAVVLPAVLVVVDVMRSKSGTALATLRRHAPRYAALVVAVACFVVARRNIVGHITRHVDMLDNPLASLPTGERVMSAVKVLGLYAWRLLVPLRLSADYSYDQISAVTSPLDPGFLAGLGVVVATGLLTWRAWSRLPALALGLVVLAFGFSVVANVFFPIGTIMGERLAYLPSAGFCLALGALIASAGERFAARGALAGQPLAFVVPLALLATLYGVRTIARNPVWRAPLPFFTAMVEDAPRSGRGHRELGIALGDAGRVDEARAEFERALAIKPEDGTTLYNFANVLRTAGRIDEAVELYKRTVAVLPDFPEGLENLGNTESLRGNYPEALTWLERARRLAPTDARLEMNIANTHLLMGDIPAARAGYERALALAPASPEILVNYGTFLYQQGDPAGAARAFERAVAAQPTARALVGLALSYGEQGKTAAAEAIKQRALQLFPQDPAVRQLAAMAPGTPPP